MVKLLLKYFLFLLLINGLSQQFIQSEANVDQTAADVYVHTRFYEGLPEGKKKILDHLIHYHHNPTICMALPAIRLLEKMLATSDDSTHNSDVVNKLTFLTKVVHDYIDNTMQTRVTHGDFIVPILNCCTPRDAYFRQVVTDLLIVTGDITVAGGIIISGNEEITGNLLVGGTLTVTGSSTFNNSVGVNGNNSEPAVTIAQGAGQNAIQTGDGSLAAPAYSFTGSTSTGLYSPATNQFALAANGANKINFDGLSVLVTSTYRFAATMSASQNLTSNSNNQIQFDTPLISSPDFNTSTWQYTVPVTGIYFVSFNLTLSSTLASDFTYVYVQTNPGSQNLFSTNVILSATPGQYTTSSGSLIVRLTAGTTLRLNCNGSSSLVDTMSTLSSVLNEYTFSAYLLSVEN